MFTKIDFIPDFKPVSIPVEHEKKLGDLMLDQYLIGVKKVENKTVTDAIDIIEERLLDALDSTDYQYNIIVVDVPEVNAFATLGGNIVVFTGLIKLAETPEEVAAVLAHEIGHVEERHVVNKLAAELGLTVVLALLSNGDPLIIQEVLKVLISSSFSRSQETDADNFAFELLDKAHIDPANFATFFERMKKEQEDYPEEMEMVMTHPHSNLRIDAAYNYADKHPVKVKPLDIDWAAVKKALGVNTATTEPTTPAF